MSVDSFDFDWDSRYRPAGLLFGITPRTARVEVSPTELRVRYGPWSLRTALGNVTGVEVSGGYAYLKTAGPPHLSFGDRGISFATNGRTGLCVRFREPVKGIDPTGHLTHPGATLTVRDVAGLAEALGFPLDS